MSALIGGNRLLSRRTRGARRVSPNRRMFRHAWVEVLVPGMNWVALDPTNRKWCDERYVTVSYGRDSRDAAPLRGTFKGAGGQKMTVKVLIERLKA